MKNIILIAIFLTGFVMAFGMFAYSLSTMEHNDSTDIVCDANTETMISQPNEYPAWTLECHNTKHRIIVID